MMFVLSLLTRILQVCELFQLKQIFLFMVCAQQFKSNSRDSRYKSVATQIPRDGI